MWVCTVAGTPGTWVQAGAGAYQPLDSDLTAIAALSTTAYGRAFLALADAAAARTALALGTLATQSGTFSGTSSGTNTGDQTLPTMASLSGTAAADFSLNTHKLTAVTAGAATGNAATWEQTVTGLAAAAGDIFYATVAGAATNLAAGTAGQHLVMNSGATAPSWVNEVAGPNSPASTGYVIAPEGAIAGSTVTPSSSAANSLQLVVWVPFCVYSTTSLDGMSVEITAANSAGTVRLGLFNQGANGKPGTFIVEVGTPPVVTSTGVVGGTFATTTLQPGYYYAALVCQGINTGGTNPAFRSAQRNQRDGLPAGTAIPGSNALFFRYTQGSVSGALSTATTPAYSGATSPLQMPCFWLLVH